MTIKRVFLILIGLEIVNMGVRETIDPDMWWHLRTGELILDQGIPRADPFSYTRLGVEWITHEWLSEIIMWCAYLVGGLPGLAVVFALVAGATFWLVLGCSLGRPYLAGMVTLVAAFTAAPTFGSRPQVLNLLLMAVFVFVVERVRNHKLDVHWLALLPVLIIPWVNMHSGYLLGVVLLATYAVGEGFEAWWAGRGGAECDVTPDGRRARVLGLAALACFFTALLNPNGWHMWIYPFGTLGSDLMQDHIIEWASPDFHLPMYWPFVALLFTGIVAWAFGPKRPPAPDALLFLGTAAAALLSRRHVSLFAVVAAPVVARAIYVAVRDHHVFRMLHDDDGDAAISRGKAILNWTVLVVACVALLSWDVRKLAGNDEVIARVYPKAAVDWIESQGWQDRRMFNTYIWGGYLIWRGLPTYVDGRADVQGEFLRYYMKTFQLTTEWRTPLDEYDVDYVICEPDSRLTGLLDASCEWDVAYEDDVARIFTRVGDQVALAPGGEVPPVR